MLVSAPASSANLGPGFDCLALALDLPFLLAVGEVGDPGAGGDPEGGTAADWHLAEPRHPATVAFVEAGGPPDAVLRWQSRIPPGRGLGYSGAARVAGAFAAARLDGLGVSEARDGALRLATVLEGHGDNAAASAVGGFVVAAGERVVRVDVPEDLAVVAWSPDASTSTDASRKRLPDRVDLADAAFSVARSALWVAALASGDLASLREATEDRLHQDLRLSSRPDSAAAREALLAQPAVLGAWLSGSGPTVAALVPTGSVAEVASRLPGGGSVRTLSIDRAGVVETGDVTPSGPAAQES